MLCAVIIPKFTLNVCAENDPEAEDSGKIFG